MMVSIMAFDKPCSGAKNSRLGYSNGFKKMILKTLK
jgi:hypothetical protein